MAKKLPQWMDDFETTTDPNDCRVWLWTSAEIGNYSNVRGGTNIESYISYVSKTPRIVFFHNLAFDARFILDYLMRNGYTYTDERRIPKGRFTALISDMGKFYTVKVHFQNGVTVEFRDSLKKIPMTVRETAKTFNHEAPKGDIDYTLPRAPDYVPTPEEWDYGFKDVQIVADALAQLEQQGMTKLTVASSALAEYKSVISTKLFNRLFPVLHKNIDDDIRDAYKGGYTFCDERFRAKKQGTGVVFDVNSLYPYVMRHKLLPYGQPVFFRGKPDNDPEMPLQVFSVTVTAKLRENHIPILQIKGGSMFNPVEYQKEIPEPTRITVTNIDWELYNEHYEIDVLQWHGGWKFKGAHDMFNPYIDKWMQVKEATTGGMRAIAKLYLNSLYGKFGSNPVVGGKYPVYDDGVVKLKLLPDDTKDPVYTAMAVFVTAYARDHTIRAAQGQYHRFAYCDTDSLHLIGPGIPSELEVHPTKLGAWKFEYMFTEGLFLGPKKYLETTTDGKRENHIAGVPVDAMAQLSIDDIHNGMEITGKLHPRYVPGGVVLEDVVYTLKY